jgi:hypothetical protein
VQQDDRRQVCTRAPHDILGFSSSVFVCTHRARVFAARFPLQRMAQSSNAADLESRRQAAVDRIRFLTTVLDGIQADSAIEMASSTKQSSRMRFLNHLATMLNTGTGAYHVVAVTCTIDIVSTRAAILVSSNTYNDTKSTPTILDGQVTATRLDISSTNTATLEEKQAMKTLLEHPTPVLYDATRSFCSC